MVSQRDPARYGMFVAVGALDLVVGVLLALNDSSAFTRVAGILLTVAAVVMLVVAIPGYRRERARRD